MKEITTKNELLSQQSIDLANAMPLLVWACDSEGYITFWNQKIVRYAQPFKHIRDALGYIHEDDVQNTRSIWRRSRKEQKPYALQHRLRMRDGTYRWHSSQGNPIFDDNGMVVKWYGSSIDIDDTKKFEQEADRQSALRRLISQNASLGLLILDNHLYCTYINASAEKIIGYSADEIYAINKPLYEIVRYRNPDGLVNPDTYCHTKHGLQLGFERTEGDDYFVRPDGSLYPVSYIASPINEGGYIVGTLIELRDMTDARQAEIEKARLHLLDAERNELLKLNKIKDEFIGLASHQLRTPATAVKQYVGMIIQGMAGDLPDNQLRLLKTAYESNERQLELINGLLKTAQIDSSTYVLNRELSNISNIVKDAVEAIKPSCDYKKQEIIYRTNAPSIHAVVDSTEFRLVVSNLLENALKYSHEKTKISVLLKENQRTFTLQIKDQGVGIPSDAVDSIFDKFVRLDNDLSKSVSGTGLGLYWVKQICELHGGDVSVRSLVGRGTTFIVKLPK